MKRWLLALLCSSTLVFGGDFPLKARLEKAKSGDYIVTEAGQMITVLAIRSATPTSMILEEISAPAKSLKKQPASWADWVKAKAPGHTSWSMIEIEPESGQVLECYSFSRRAWIQLSKQESLIATLLRLPLTPIAPDKRKKIGPPPTPGEMDTRKVWNPPLIFEGRKIESTQYDVYETTWPSDGTEMSGKEVILYFDREKRFPLPNWIQVETAHATGHLRTLDAGKNLPAPHATMPRRVPQFIGSPQKTDTGLRLSLKSPKYYKQFELFAIDVTGKQKQIFPITHSLVRGEEESLTLEIDQEELKQTLEPDHRYTWLLVPTGHSESYTETQKPFVWTDKN
jgi:hypothetical protein